MRKFISLFVVSLLFVCLLSFCVSAEKDYFYDGAGLIDSAGEEKLEKYLKELSEELRFDIVVATFNGIDGNIQSFTDDYYDNGGYGYGSGYDGAILLLDMNEREYWVSTCGYGIKALNDNDLDNICDDFIEYISGEDYYNGFKVFADKTKRYIEIYREYENSPNSGYDDYYGGGIDIGSTVISSVILGMLFALIPVCIMKGKLTSVRNETQANRYIRSDSMDVRVARDVYLYSTVTKRPKNTDNGGSRGGPRGGGHSGGSSHISSSGRSHGGRGGHF